MFLKIHYVYFFGILFNNRCQSHKNDNKKFNRLVHLAIYSDTFSY